MSKLKGATYKYKFESKYMSKKEEFMGKENNLLNSSPSLRSPSSLCGAEWRKSYLRNKYMKKIINTLLRWKLELRRFFNNGRLKSEDWSVLLKLRKK